jgi:glycogen operon protein
LNGKAIQTPDDRGRSITDDSFLLLFNAHTEAVEWTIPPGYAKAWRLVLDTERLQPEVDPPPVGGQITTAAGSMVVLEAS